MSLSRKEIAMRITTTAALILAAMILPAQAVQPVKGAVKGTATVGKGVVKGTAEAGKGVARGTGTVVRGTGRGLRCIFTLGIRC
jgi:hypothetical protein